MNPDLSQTPSPTWPATVVWTVRTVVAILLAVGLYLIAVRGDVLIEDLSRIAAIICA